MKFSEIKKFPHATYRVNISWAYLKEWLKDQGEFFNLQLDPPFQRGYKWTDKQKTAFIEYQLKGGFSGKDIYWNCLKWQEGSKQNDELQLVDGKQRINAVLEFIDNKVLVFNGLKIKDFNRLPYTKYDLLFHINNLETQIEVVEWYLGLNTGGAIHTEEDLRPAFNYMKKLLADEMSFNN